MLRLRCHPTVWGDDDVAQSDATLGMRYGGLPISQDYLLNVVDRFR